MTTYLESNAIFTAFKQYRYLLKRVWQPDKPMVTFIGLNPSIADKTTDDPTIRRCVNFAKSWGYGGLFMGNLFAYVATNPSELTKALDSVGELNDNYLLTMVTKSELVIAAWGNWGSYLGRDKAVIKMIPNLHCLKMTKQNQPSHPLYLKADTMPKPI